MAGAGLGEFCTDGGCGGGCSIDGSAFGFDWVAGEMIGRIAVGSKPGAEYR